MKIVALKDGMGRWWTAEYMGDKVQEKYAKFVFGKLRRKTEKRLLLNKSIKPKPMDKVMPVQEKMYVIDPVHIPGCLAQKWVRKEHYPFEWNVIQPFKELNCDEDGNVLTREGFAKKGYSQIWYEIRCADPDCPARKRINAKLLGLFPNVTTK